MTLSNILLVDEFFLINDCVSVIPQFCPNFFIFFINLDLHVVLHIFIVLSALSMAIWFCLLLIMSSLLKVNHLAFVHGHPKVYFEFWFV